MSLTPLFQLRKKEHDKNRKKSIEEGLHTNKTLKKTVAVPRGGANNILPSDPLQPCHLFLVAIVLKCPLEPVISDFFPTNLTPPTHTQQIFIDFCSLYDLVPKSAIFSFKTSTLGKALTLMALSQQFLLP